jgi:hypothetical protein
LTSCDYQGSPDKVIEEINYIFSCWISYVASTGLHYDVEMKEIAAITPRPDFLPVLRLLEDVVEYEEATGTLVTGRWRRRNRRESVSLSPTLTLFLAPHGKLHLRLQERVPERKSVRLAASTPPKTMASSNEIPDAILQVTDFSNGYPK